MRLMTAAAVALALWPNAGQVQTGPLLSECPLALGPGLSRAWTAPMRFNLVAFRWHGQGSLRFRSRDENGDWGRWLAAAGEPTGSKGAWTVSDPAWTGASDRVQVRAEGDVEDLRATYIWSDPDPAATRRLTTTSTPTLATRADWGADESLRRSKPVYAPTLQLAVIHHTAGSNNYTAAQSAAIVRAIYAYHVRTLGWNDLGYSFLIDKYGQVFEGRYGGIDRNVVGAHAAGFNTGSVGIALIGDYRKTAVSAAARRALVELLAWRLDVAHLDPRAKVKVVSSGNSRYPSGAEVQLPVVVGHRDTGPTECPGDRLEQLLPAIASEAAATGGAKIFAPSVKGTVGGLVRFTARLSTALPWTVTVTSGSEPVASGSGSGTAVDWTWDASAADPALGYEWTIAAGADVRPATGTIGAASTETAPAISEPRLLTAVVSPNGDGLDDTLRLHYRLTRRADVELSLKDAADQVVATLLAESQPAGAQNLDLALDMAADGRYQVVLVARNKAGEKRVSWQVTVTRTLSSLSISPTTISPNGDGRNDTLLLSFSLSQAVAIDYRILRGSSAVASYIGGALAPGSQSFGWNGLSDGSPVADGSYELELTVTDSILSFRQRIPFRIDTRAPKLRLLARQPLRLWLSEPARLVVYLNGRRLQKTAKQAGPYLVPTANPVRSLRVVAVDAAENRSLPLRLRTR
jgi:hypothetical protein